MIQLSTNRVHAVLDASQYLFVSFEIRLQWFTIQKAASFQYQSLWPNPRHKHYKNKMFISLQFVTHTLLSTKTSFSHSSSNPLIPPGTSLLHGVYDTVLFHLPHDFISNRERFRSGLSCLHYFVESIRLCLFQHFSLISWLLLWLSWPVSVLSVFIVNISNFVVLSSHSLPWIHIDIVKIDWMHNTVQLTSCLATWRC